MKKIITSLFFLVPCITFGQLTAKEYIKQGVALHDSGKYKEAIESYEKALVVEKDCQDAIYEIALSNVSLKNYQEAIKHADILIKFKKDFVGKGYHLKGMSLDYLGKPQEAIDVFKKGIKTSPDYTTLYYSLAITSYKLEDIITTEKALQDGLSRNPFHSKSHYLLAILNEYKRSKSLLALYNYLLLEPEGKTANAAYNLILSQHKIGVTEGEDKTINVSINPNEDDGFSTAEMSLSIMEAASYTEEYKSKSDFEKFSENTKSFFMILGELKEKDKLKGFWWDFYVGFFSDLAKDNELYETFTYYISQDINSTLVETWLRKNSDRVEKLQEWVANYKRSKNQIK
ncbi:photosystem I assembly protein Ycf3 [compost metagenome]